MFYLATMTLLYLISSGPPPQPMDPSIPIPPVDVPPRENAGHAAVGVRTDVGWVGPSQSFHVIVHITPDPLWHVYWKNPGASGAPTTIEINTPDGFIVGEAEFPRPSIFHGDEGLTFGYGESFALFIPVTAPPTLQDGQVDFEVTTSWLACKKLCVMGEKTTTLTISTNYLHHGPTHRDRQLSRWALAIPHQLSDLEQGEVSIVGNTLSISGDTTLRPIRFIGIEKIGVRFGIPEQIIVSGTKFRLPIPLFIDTKAIKGDEIIIEGLLMFGRNSSEPAYVVQHKVQFFHPHVENVIRR